jgi:hypothetical protein
LLPSVGQSAEEVVLAPLSLRQQPPRRRVSNSRGVVIPSITKLLVFGKKALTNCRLRPEDRLRFLARENPTSEFSGDIEAGADVAELLDADVHSLENVCRSVNSIEQSLLEREVVDIDGCLSPNS